MLSNPDEAGMWRGTPAATGIGSLTLNSSNCAITPSFRWTDGIAELPGSLANPLQGGEWEETQGRMVSGGYFQVLGVSPSLGRGFTAADDRSEAHSTVISYNYWQRRFGGRPDVLGKTLVLRNAVLTIIGVAPAGFIGETIGQEPDFWLPLRMQPLESPARIGCMIRLPRRRCGCMYSAG